MFQEPTTSEALCRLRPGRCRPFRACVMEGPPEEAGESAPGLPKAKKAELAPRPACMGWIHLGCMACMWQVMGV